MKQKSDYPISTKVSRVFLGLGTVLLLLFTTTETGISALGPNKRKKIKYRTNFGSCPSRSAGQMTLKMIKTFEETGSLKQVKSELVKRSLPERHFVSDYKVSYDPMKKLLNVDLNCPKPLMKVQIYKENGIDSYEAILVESGELFDPTYEVLLRTEKKLEGPLPYLAIPVGELEEDKQNQITRVVSSWNDVFRSKISEIILNDKGELTVIMSLRGSPSSVFMGKEEWESKAGQLEKIVKYMESNKKIPAIINLTNSKKVVVKFNSNL